MLGSSAATTAAAWIRGTAWNAWAPMSRPMYSRIGTMAGVGSTVASTPNRPRKHRTAMNRPLAIE